MFYEKFRQICQERGVAMTTVLKDLGWSTSKLTAWKNGSVPKQMYIDRISEYFDVPTDFLLGFTEVKSQSTLSVLKNVLSANPQRIVSLRNSGKILDSERNIISKYMKCSLAYLFGQEQEYEPQENDTAITFSDVSAAVLICDVLDRCASNEEFKVLQIQISRIIIYNLARKGINKERLADAVCSQINTKHINTVWAERTVVEC